jgi:molybdenum cofactor cytidylyltransferase
MTAVSPWTLPRAFNLEPGALVAIVGGGGKSSLLFALGAALGPGTALTTTTRIFAAQMQQAPAVCFLDAPESGWTPPETAVGTLADLERFLAEYGRCLVVGEVEPTGGAQKALGVPPALPGQLLDRPGVQNVLVEADGSRMRPAKAPAAHEPVIPPGTTRLVPVLGIDALNGPIAETSHRPRRVAALTGLSPAAALTPAAAGALLVHPQGGLKDLPPGAQAIPLINKVETAADLAAARRVAAHALRQAPPAAPQVVIGAVRTEEPVREVARRVTAVILAAGQASRMGAVKQLLPWGKGAMLEETLRQAGESLATETLVVTGHAAGRVGALARRAGARTVHNPGYARGEMLSSLQAAVRRLPATTAAILVMLADQPLVETAVLDKLVATYWREAPGIVAPTYQGRRGNPVLIDRRHFPELLALPVGAAPRHLLRRRQAEIRLVPVETPAVVQDIDTPQMYRRLRP